MAAALIWLSVSGGGLGCGGLGGIGPGGSGPVCGGQGGGGGGVQFGEIAGDGDEGLPPAKKILSEERYCRTPLRNQPEEENSKSYNNGSTKPK